jgi:hypothetical protein
MAHRFRLAKYGYNNALVTSIDLITSPWKLVDRSWQTETCKPNVKYDHTPFGHQPAFQYYESVVETFSVIATDTVVNLLYQLKRLEDVMEEIRQYHDRVPTANQWWLEWHVDGEEERRALFYTGQMEYPALVAMSPMIECQTIVVKFAFVRHPLWENDASTTVVDQIAMPTDGVHASDKMILTGIEGTAPARIEHAEVLLSATPWMLTPQTYEYWMGIRPYHDGVANFDSVWEAELGTNDVDTADVADGSCSNNWKVVTTFVDTTLVRRFYLQVQNIATVVGREVDYIGRYLVLARMRLDAAGTVGVQMRSGYSDQIIHEELYVESTLWYLYELGEIEIPPASDPAMYYRNWLRSFMVSVYAERLSGTPNLEVDLLCLIPTEHFLHVSGSIISYDPTNNKRDGIFTMANDTMFAIGYTKAAPDVVNDALSLIPLNWYIPQEGGALVMIGQGPILHNLGETYEVQLEYYPRWLSYRYDEET